MIKFRLVKKLNGKYDYIAHGDGVHTAFHLRVVNLATLRWCRKKAREQAKEWITKQDTI